MKNQSNTLLPKIKFIESDGSFDFLKGKKFFAEKHAKAKEELSKMVIPEKFRPKNK